MLITQYYKHINKERERVEKIVLKYIMKEKIFIFKEIEDLAQLPSSQVKKIIEKFLSEGKIENVGIGVWKTKI